MNKVIIMGRLVREPETKYTQASEPMAITKYTLAVNRRFKKDGEADADFLNIVAFGKNGEFAEKFFTKGQQVCVVGHLQTGNYTNKEGIKVYTTDVIAEEQHFADTKKGESKSEVKTKDPVAEFVELDDTETLPF